MRPRANKNVARDAYLLPAGRDQDVKASPPIFLLTVYRRGNGLHLMASVGR